MNLRVALRWLIDRRFTAGTLRRDVFNRPDPEDPEDVVDWLCGNDHEASRRRDKQRLSLLVEAGGEVG